MLHASGRTKPTGIPRIYETGGMPVFWAPMLRPGPTRGFPGGGGSTYPGDVADITGNVAAGVRDGGCTWASGPFGPAILIDGSTGYVDLSGTGGFERHLSEATILCRLYSAGTPNSYTGIAYSRGGADSPAGLSCSSSGDILGYNWDDLSSQWGWVPSLPAIPTGRWFVAALVITPASATIYQCSGGVVARDSNPVANSTNYVTALKLGVDVFSPATRTWGGLIDDVRIYDHALTASQVAREYADPWWRLRPPPRRVAYAAMGGGGTAYTLAGGTGGFAETGGAAALLADRLLPGAGGACSETGNAAALLLDRALAGGTGGFAEGGSSAALLHGRVLAAQGGTFAGSGAAAGLLYDRLLPAGGGSYALTGDAAAPYETGSSSTYTLAGGTGGFAEGGSSAALPWSHVLAGGAGAYTEAGDGAALLARRLIGAAGGSYGGAGGPAAILARRRLAGGPGAFAEAGDGASLIYSGSGPSGPPPVPDPGRSHGVRVGPDPGFAAGVRIGPDPGMSSGMR